MLRLLPKSEVDKAKALDRQREVEEGKKLASRVDILRQTHAKEETELSQFRSKTLANIQLEINTEIDRLEVAKREVREKREELLSLSGPLDKAWKFYVTSERAKLAELQAEVLSRESKLDALLAKNASLREEMESAKRSFEEGQRENLKNRALARQMVADSEQVLAETRNKAQKLLSRAELKEKEASKRIAQAVEHENFNKLEDSRLKQKEDELETREMAALAKELLYYSPVKKP